jgi:hypothetical protein
VTLRAIVAGLLVTVGAYAAAAAHPSPPEGFESALIGLLEVPIIYDTAESADPKPPAPAPLDVRAEPFATATIVATIDGEGLTTRDGVRCFWRREPTCQYHESGYEEPALAVFGRRVAGPVETTRGTWYRIAIDREGRRFGWLRSEAPFHELAALVASKERLTYLTPAWRGTLYGRPGAERARPALRSSDPRPQRPYRALRPTMIGGQLWIEIELLAGVCEGEERVIDKGWVPVRNVSGALNAWYWSRGC